MRVKIGELRKICVKILTQKGLSKKDALAVFNEYLQGQLRGRECHGFQAFPEFAAKLVGHDGKPKIIREEDNLLFIDGNKNLGQIVCNEFVPQLIKKAKKKRIAMMGIYNMRSYLMPGTYARLAAEDNVVGLVFNYGGWPRIAPTGSIDPIFGTNPIAIGIPGKDFCIVIDMATSDYNMMRVRLAKKLGQKIPAGVAMDKNGKPTTDPAKVMEGALLPFGGHKGSALALTVEILTRVMFNVNIHDKTTISRGFFFVFFDPAVFQPINKFKESVSKLARKIKKSRKVPGVAEIFLPGEHSGKTAQKNRKLAYVELDKKIIESIYGLNESQ